jgi:hypothetical protein
MYKHLQGPGSKALADAGMVFLIIMAKNGPDREAMIAAHNKLPNCKEGCDLPKLDYDRLTHALQHLSRNHDPKEQAMWNKGPNKGTASKMGLAMFALKSLGLIRPNPKGELTLLTSRRKFSISPLTAKLRRKLSRTRVYGAAMLKQAKTKMCTLSDYRVALKSMGSCSKGVPGLTSTRSYFFRWSARAWLDYLIRKSGKHGLKIPKDTKVRTLKLCFPDQSANLDALSGASGPNSSDLSEMCDLLHYQKQPIEHLTMHLCLCLTPKIRQIMQTVVSERTTLTQERHLTQKLARIRKRLTGKSKFGILIPPHPSVVVSHAYATKALKPIAESSKAA